MTPGQVAGAAGMALLGLAFVFAFDPAPRRRHAFLFDDAARGALAWLRPRLARRKVPQHTPSTLNNDAFHKRSFA